jgi:hypothetical protein
MDDEMGWTCGTDWGEKRKAYRILEKKILKRAAA